MRPQGPRVVRETTQTQCRSRSEHYEIDIFSSMEKNDEKKKGEGAHDDGERNQDE